MMRLSFALAVLLAGCGTQSEAERMKEACDARVCPSNPPRDVDCMPFIPEEWLPVCNSASCLAFLHDTCGIELSS